MALLAFGIASAQNDSPTPPPATAPAMQQMTPEIKKEKTDAKSQNQVPATSEQRKMRDGAQPRKDELKTQDHVKSTPDTNAAKKDDKGKSAKRSQKKKVS